MKNHLIGSANIESRSLSLLMYLRDLRHLIKLKMTLWVNYILYPCFSKFYFCQIVFFSNYDNLSIYLTYINLANSRKDSEVIVLDENNYLNMQKATEKVEVVWISDSDDDQMTNPTLSFTNEKQSKFTLFLKLKIFWSSKITLWQLPSIVPSKLYL